MTNPNFLIIGAQKAGTTALYHALARHPEVFMATPKEPQFFAWQSVMEKAKGPRDASADLVCTRQEYAQLFAGANGARARGEASTIYLYAQESAQRIRDQIPDVKLIILFRDPVRRAYSNFLHLVRDGREQVGDFAAALALEDERRANGWSANWRYRDKGFYARQLERYLKVFDPEQFRFYLYEDFDRNPAPIVKDIYRFIGVDDSFTQDLAARLNVGGYPKHRGLQSMLRYLESVKWAVDPVIPNSWRRRFLSVQNSNLSRPALSRDVQEELLSGYREDIEMLGDLTGLDVGRWTMGSPRHPECQEAGVPFTPGL